MTTTTITVPVAELRAGDTFCDPTEGPVWTALRDAQVDGFEILLAVQYTADGGCSTRAWDRGATITIRREA
jgi:hypothetical protein